MRNPQHEPLGSARSGSRRAEQASSERRCILTGKSACRDDLLRLAISPPDEEGKSQVLPDVMARAPGRGAWIGVSRAELEAALEGSQLKAALARSFKDGKLTIPADLPQKIDDALRRAFADRLGLELRSGQLIMGSDRIANEARMGKVAALFHAADASADGAKKLDQAWRVGMDAEGSGMAGERLPLDRTALSVALGRDNVVHLALADGPSQQRVLLVLRRLQRFLGAEETIGETAEIGGEEVADDAATKAETTIDLKEC